MKKNQLVYFYEKTGEYQGTILAGTITSIVKDLQKGTTLYHVKVAKAFQDWDIWYVNREVVLTKDQIYTSKKQIEKEYKEEIVYNGLTRQLQHIETLLSDIRHEAREKPVIVDKWQTLTITGEKAFSKLCVSAEDITIGDRNLLEEIDKLKKEVNSIKKKIKPKTKKPVVKEEKANE